MAPVLEGLAAFGETVDTRLALTGQHDEMVDQVLRAFHLRPDYDLEIMKEGQDLYDVAQGTLEGLRKVVRHFDPELILVQGDTASVFFASLVGFLEGVRVGHVEAGLRSGNRRAPYPEEIFRRLSDVISELHFAPTPGARDHLLAEGVSPESIHLTGNPVVDALHAVARKEGPPSDPTLRGLLEEGGRLVLLTAHRRESFGEPLLEVFTAVLELVDRVPDLEVLYPVHPNPNVREPAWRTLGDHPRIHLVEPLDYLDLVSALKGASLVLTDSGGIQEEAPAFGTHVLVLREVTERPEGIGAGVATLVGTGRERILEESVLRLEKAASRKVGEGVRNPYGDGRAGERIADIVLHQLTGRPRTTTDWDGT
jgi:UDP-N-acetylglucosamine 2-epimerase (non-hydrolysing)